MEKDSQKANNWIVWAGASKQSIEHCLPGFYYQFG